MHSLRTPCASRDLDAVDPGVLPDGEPPGGADDLGQRLVAVRHRPRRVDRRDLAAGELDHRDRVVDVADFAQAFVDRDRAGGEYTCGPAGAEQPAHGVDVVDAHVEQDPAGRARVADEEAAGVVLVGGLRAREERAADRAGPDLVEDVPIAGIEPAHVADHRLLPRMLRRDRLHAQAVGKVERERLLGKNVLAGLDGGDDLVGVQRRRRGQEYGVEAGVGEQLRIVRVAVPDAERLACPGELIGNGAARGD